MDDIAGIESRLAIALERIGKAAGQVPSAADAKTTDAKTADAKTAAGEADKLRAELAAEKAASTQLTDRVTAIRERQEQMVEALEKRVMRLQERVAEQEAELGRLKRANEALRANAQSLRRAAAGGMVPGEMLNQALAAELEATRAAQAADRSELEAILSELRPLIEEKADV